MDAATPDYGCCGPESLPRQTGKDLGQGLCKCLQPSLLVRDAFAPWLCGSCNLICFDSSDYAARFAMNFARDGVPGQSQTACCLAFRFPGLALVRRGPKRQSSAAGSDSRSCCFARRHCSSFRQFFTFAVCHDASAAKTMPLSSAFHVKCCYVCNPNRLRCDPGHGSAFDRPSGRSAPWPLSELLR